MFSIGLDHTAGIYSTDLGEKKKMGGEGGEKKKRFFFFIPVTYRSLHETASCYRTTEEENDLGSLPHHTQHKHTCSISNIMFL